MTDIIFLKLGGSLITDKHTPHTPNIDTIQRLASEIAAVLKKETEIQLLLGHGSGSFGHVPAHTYGTRLGVKSADQWEGFVKVWSEARALNQIVLDAMNRAGLPAIAFPPSAAITTWNGVVSEWSLYPLRQALQNQLIPIIYGDVVFDTERGGTILSTEEVFMYLAPILRPRKILLAGLEDGVWEDYPSRTRLVLDINPANYLSVSARLGASAGIDVTGGMNSKVESMLALVANHATEVVRIFSASQPGSIQKAFFDQPIGTAIHK